MDTLENFELIDSPQSSGLTEVVCLPLLEDSDLPLPEDHGETSSEEDAFQNATFPFKISLLIDLLVPSLQTHTLSPTLLFWIARLSLLEGGALSAGSPLPS